ncbi:MAG: thioesterase family protein [Candidatus Limivicinus sp.]|nr:thioesterase family protein [Clostridiales bacterium]MDY3860335.1 thioesterase family protein [Candidatus Limivicinus sp.]
MAVFLGIKGHDEVLVTEANVAQALGSGSLPVFSTPALIISMEKAALESVQPYLDEGSSTVGVRLEADHLAATPIGMTVRTESELTGIDGRMLLFTIDSYAGDEHVGHCIHKRCIVDADRFMAKAEAKLGK